MRRVLMLLGAVSALLLTAASAAARSTSSAAGTLRSALAQGIRQSGGADGALVVDLSNGRTLFSSSPGVARIPASVEKLYTTSTALLRFGPTGSFTTEILGRGGFDGQGGWHGTVYLRGGGDPTFGSAGYDRYAYGTGATLQRLVANVIRETGIRAIYGRVVGDESYFDSVRGTPATGFKFSDYLEGLMSALVYDRGLADEQGSAYQNRPALFSTRRFADAMRAAGVKVPSQTPVYTGSTPAGARLLAVVHSPRMATLIRLTNTPSDNFFAEMLLKGIGARFGTGGSTAAGAAVVRSTVSQSFGIHPTLEDGSGLSRNDRTTPVQVVTLLQRMASAPDFVGSLAVAGRTGTLQYSLAGTPAQDRCLGKTGTLHDVASLVGYCTARNGHPLAFVFLMNSVDPTLGHAIEDQMTVAVEQYNG